VGGKDAGSGNMLAVGRFVTRVLRKVDNWYPSMENRTCRWESHLEGKCILEVV